MSVMQIIYTTLEVLTGVLFVASTLHYRRLPVVCTTENDKLDSAKRFLIFLRFNACFVTVTTCFSGVIWIVCCMNIANWDAFHILIFSYTAMANLFMLKAIKKHLPNSFGCFEPTIDSSVSLAMIVFCTLYICLAAFDILKLASQHFTY